MTAKNKGQTPWLLHAGCSVAGVCGLTYLTTLHWHLSIHLSLFPLFWFIIYNCFCTQLLFHLTQWTDLLHTVHCMVVLLHYVLSSHSIPLPPWHKFYHIFLLKMLFPTSFSPHIWLSAFGTCCLSGLLTAVFNLTFPNTIIFSVLHCATVGCTLKTEMASSSEILVPFHKTWGYVVAQLVEALLYKPEGHGFDSWCCHCNSSLT